MINQQKIYIDIDEEITTVIDRIYRTNENNIAIIVPQHALLLQSVVNLKLLAQEAKKYNKNIVIMTKDEDGIMFAQRAGITTQPFISEEDKSKIEIQATSEQLKEKDIPEYAKRIMTETAHQKTDMSMGSKSFFDNSIRNTNISGIHVPQQSVTVKQQHTLDRNKQSVQIDFVNQKKKKQGIYSEEIAQQYIPTKQIIGNDVISRRYQEDSQVQHQVSEQNRENEYLDEYEQSLRKAQLSNRIGNNIRTQQKNSPQRLSIQQDKNLQKFKKYNITDFSSTSRTIIKSFISIGILLVIFILFIILLPKTKMSVEAKHIKIDEKIELTAQTNQGVYDFERRLIPARIIERDITFTKTFTATGIGDVNAQKAQGKIKIFNEYSNKQQPLVATTRFLAQNGTLFRLVNQVIVPGMKNSEPGQVEALIIADKPGDDGNIGPTKFSIPGFEGSPKKDKFYAISEKAMSGGGIGGAGVTIVTENDIEKAKEEMKSEYEQYVMEQITGLLRPDNEVLIDKNVLQTLISSGASVSAGTMADQFMYEMVIHVKALVFSENDVFAVMESSLVKKYHQYDSERVNVKIEYEDVVPNFEKESIKMVARGMADIVATVDIATFKKDIIGKKHQEILKIMEDNYGDEIEKITIEKVFPGFPRFIANRISHFGFMTNVSVK